MPRNCIIGLCSLLICASAAMAVEIGVQDGRFTIDGRPTFLLGCSYYGAVGAADDIARKDLDQLKQLGFNWVRVWATWPGFNNDVSAVDGDGQPREPCLTKLKWLIEECDQRGMIVNVSLSRGNGVAGSPRLQGLEPHRRAVQTLVTALKPHRNWYLDLSNERNIKDKRFTSIDDLVNLLALAKQLDGRRLITASHTGMLSKSELEQYLKIVKVDFVSLHRPRDAGSPAQTLPRTKQLLAWISEIRPGVPLHYDEPFRRGYASWNPAAADFLTDLNNARSGGAAGWCFHNGDERTKPDGRPRRSFDLRDGSLFDQLDEQERRFFQMVKDARPVGTRVEPIRDPIGYPDGRPSAKFRLAAIDHGVVFRHGAGPNQCDQLGARDVWVWEHRGTYYMHYDGSGPKGWLACLATSADLTTWAAKGPAIDFGRPDQKDSASASYGVIFHDGQKWHMFYLGTPNTSGPPNFIPAFPYLTMKAEAASPAGPWAKRYDITPFTPKPGTYYSVTTSPGHTIRHGAEYLMFFAASTDAPIFRTISIARTRNLDGPWTIDDKPILPPSEQIENTSIYYQESSKTWFLFTNHVGLKEGLEYTDAVWVYWTQDLQKWNPQNKAVVLDGSNCKWSKHIIGLPSVVRVGNRLALFYDGHPGATIPAGVKSHMHRDVGLAWLDLPLHTP